jgi:hypothetical protein
MAIFTDNTSRIEAPNNTALAIELSKRIGEANPGKAIATALNGWAGDVHDYTYGTAMGIANDIKAARDEFGNLKDADGRFVNDNDKVRALLAGRNPNWTANNYADANMEDWYKGRDQEGRSIEKLILDKAAGDRDQQRVNIAKATLAMQQQKYNDERNADRLFAQYKEILKKSPDLVSSWVDENARALQGNPTAYKLIMNDIAGNSSINMVPFMPGDAGQIQLASESTVTDALNDVTAKENLNNAGGFEVFVNPDLETKGQSTTELLQQKLKDLGYSGNSAETFTTHFNRAVTALKALGASDKEVAALMRNADKEGWWHWSVNDYDTAALEDRWKEMNKEVAGTGKTQLQIRRDNARQYAQIRQNLQAMEAGKTITALNNEYMQRRLAIEQMYKSGKISNLKRESALGVINNWYRQSVGQKQDGVNKARELLKAVS